MRRRIHTVEERASSHKPREGQQEAEDGEVEASRMRHVSPGAVTHMHTDYADRFISKRIGGRSLPTLVCLA